MSDFLKDLFKEDESIPFEKRERKEWVQKDPFGGEMTVVTIGKIFLMMIPHQATKMTPEEAERFRANLKSYGEHKWEPGDNEITFITNRDKSI